MVKTSDSYESLNFTIFSQHFDKIIYFTFFFTTFIYQKIESILYFIECIVLKIC